MGESGTAYRVRLQRQGGKGKTVGTRWLRCALQRTGRAGPCGRTYSRRLPRPSASTSFAPIRPGWGFAGRVYNDDLIKIIESETAPEAGSTLSRWSIRTSRTPTPCNIPSAFSGSHLQPGAGNGPRRTRGVKFLMQRWFNEPDRLTGLRPNPRLNVNYYVDESQQTSYVSWQTSLRKRFSHGLSASTPLHLGQEPVHRRRRHRRLLPGRRRRAHTGLLQSQGGSRPQHRRHRPLLHQRMDVQRPRFPGMDNAAGPASSWRVASSQAPCSPAPGLPVQLWSGRYRTERLSSGLHRWRTNPSETIRKL